MEASEPVDDSPATQLAGSSTMGRNRMLLVALAACSAVLIAGLWLTFGVGNVRDFDRYRAFTSASHAPDRCAAQDAMATQAKIREFFAAKGGITDEQAKGMGPVVGLTPAEMKSVAQANLYGLDLGCEDTVANPQVVVFGIILSTGAIAAFGGVLVGVRFRRRPVQSGRDVDPES